MRVLPTRVRLYHLPSTLRRVRLRAALHYLDVVCFLTRFCQLLYSNLLRRHDFYKAERLQSLFPLLP